MLTFHFLKVFYLFSKVALGLWYYHLYKFFLCLWEWFDTSYNSPLFRMSKLSKGNIKFWYFILFIMVSIKLARDYDFSSKSIEVRVKFNCRAWLSQKFFFLLSRVDLQYCVGSDVWQSDLVLYIFFKNTCILLPFDYFLL